MAQFAGSDRIGRTCQYSRTSISQGPGKDRSWVVQEVIQAGVEGTHLSRTAEMRQGVEESRQ